MASSQQRTTIEEIDLTDFDQIYYIHDDEKGYVGKVSVLDKQGQPRGFEKREEEHRMAAQIGEVRNCARLLARAIAEKGWDNFTGELLETVDRSKSVEREIFWINEMNTVSPKGYNLIGGIDDKYVLHPDTKELMRQSHQSFGKAAQKRFTVKVERKITKTGVGYRGFFNGTPKGFFSNTLTESEKKAKAIHYNLTGDSEYDRRIPRARQHADGDGLNITQAGVKAHYNDFGRLTGYRAYHPTRPYLKSKTFESQKDAISYAKLLMSFSEQSTPEEYIADKVPEKPRDQLYIKPKKHSKGTSQIPKGALVGYEVAIPAAASTSGDKIGRGFTDTKNSVTDNLQLAVRFRDEHIKPELIIW